MSKDDIILRNMQALALKETKTIVEDTSLGTIWTQELSDKYHNLPIETILLDKDIFNASDWLYPSHLDDIKLIFEMKEKYNIDTVIDIEGIGSGKTLGKIGLIIALQVYKALTLMNPQKSYGMAPDTTLAFILMSKTEQKARNVTYQSILPLFNNPFFREFFPPTPSFVDIEARQISPSKLQFPKRVIVFPGTGSAASALGYNIVGAAIDEANYLEISLESRKATILEGGHYDAAEQMHFEIYNRMQSRFVNQQGNMPGFIIMSSNPRYEGDFLERWAAKDGLERIDDYRWINKKSRMLLIRRATWEAKPEGSYGEGYFWFDFENLKVVEAKA